MTFSYGFIFFISNLVGTIVGVLFLVLSLHFFKNKTPVSINSVKRIVISEYVCTIYAELVVWYSKPKEVKKLFALILKNANHKCPL